MCEFFANYLEKHVAINMLRLINAKRNIILSLSGSRYLLEIRYDNIARQ